MTELNWGEDGELRISGALPAGVPASAAADCLLVLRHLDGWDIRTVRPHLDGGSFGRKIYRCSAGPGGAGIRLVVGPALGVTERGRIRRRLLRDIYYRLQRLLPVRNQLLLSSFHGKQCADNPRGIADELRRRGDRRKNIWAINDWSVPVPE